MPLEAGSSIRLSHEVHGTGEPVLLIPPAAASAALWKSHQVPALVAAGYKAVLVETRGTAPSPTPPGPYRLDDLVADIVGLITSMGAGPCRLVGASLGAMVAQETALARPDLVTAAVLLGTRARSDFYRRSLARAAASRAREGAASSDLEALLQMSQFFGPGSLADERFVADWLAVMRRFPVHGPGPAAQLEASVIADRRAALRGVSKPCLAVAFEQDVIAPPALVREVAEAIPNAHCVQIAGTGHFGFLEAPEAVNKAMLDFFT